MISLKNHLRENAFRKKHSGHEKQDLREMCAKRSDASLHIDGPTIPTYDMPILSGLWYLTRKLVNFTWRYRENPLYLFTYLRFIADGSYKEQVNFMSDETFIEAAKKRSTLRFGDGEFTLLLGTRDLAYEQKNDRLIDMWKEAISSYTDSSPYILGLPPYLLIENKALHANRFKYLWMPAKILYRLWFPKKPVYFNVTYFYIDNTCIPFMQALSRNNDILLVTNKDVIDATCPHEENFFKYAKSVAYIETPEKNAFAHYEQIMRTIETHLTPRTVIFMACGPAGKAMIYDLAKRGILAHDIGYGLTGAYTGESREHFLKWNIFGPLYAKARK